MEWETMAGVSMQHLQCHSQGLGVGGNQYTCVQTLLLVGFWLLVFWSCQNIVWTFKLSTHVMVMYVHITAFPITCECMTEARNPTSCDRLFCLSLVYEALFTVGTDAGAPVQKEQQPSYTASLMSMHSAIHKAGHQRCRNGQTSSLINNYTLGDSD